jgi:hypothetical protein
MSTANVASTICEAYARAKETYCTEDAHEITEEAYFEALEVLPPVYGKQTDTQRGRFWVGEPYSHQGEAAVSLECWEQRGNTGRYFCRLSVCPTNRF